MENANNQNFLIFALRFLPFQKRNHHFSTIFLVVRKCFQFAFVSKILSFDTVNYVMVY